jgi:hypothetical protein
LYNSVDTAASVDFIPQGLDQLLDSRLVTALVVWSSLLTVIVISVLTVMMAPNGVVGRLAGENSRLSTSSSDFSVDHFDGVESVDALRRTQSTAENSPNSQSSSVYSTIDDRFSTLSRDLPTDGRHSDVTSALRDENWLLLRFDEYETLVSRDHQSAS